MMEKTILVTLAFLVTFYCASTEILDSTGRIEVIRRYFPAFPKFLETRTFRMLLLLATGGLAAKKVPLGHFSSIPELKLSASPLWWIDF
jgi:hypothetical protein